MQGDVFITSYLNSYLTYVLHNVKWKSVCVEVCVVVWEWKTQRSTNIYMNVTWYCSASQNKPWCSIYARTVSVYAMYCASMLGVLDFRGVLFT